MTGTAIFIGWGGTYPGREQHALGTFAATMELLEGLRRQGEIEGFEPVLLGPHGGRLDGFILVHGGAEKLDALPHREDMRRLRVRAELDHARLWVIPALTGERVPQEMALWGEATEELVRELAVA